MARRDAIFSAEASKGYVLKVAIDTLCGPLQRAILNINKHGISIRQQDQGSTILYDVSFPRKNFRGFKCKRPMVISFNLKHMQSLLKNVKKKDSIAIYIDGNQPNKLFITIRPEGTRKNTRFETNDIVYQEEKDHQPLELPDGGYRNPMVIDAADFQKIKKLTSHGKIIDVSIQRSNYLSFKCDAGVVYSSELGFGEILENPDEDEDDEEEQQICKNNSHVDDCQCVCGTCEEPIRDCGCICEGCEEYIQDCSCVCEECEEYLQECSCGNEIPDGEIKGMFKAKYYSSILAKLIKLPGLCTQMQFYAPSIPQFPLRIEVNAGQGGFTLGTIQVFVKDVEQITYEESISNDKDTVVSSVKTKTKKNG